MGSGGGGGFFNQIAEFFTPGLTDAKAGIQEAEVNVQKDKVIQEIARRDQKDKLTKTRDEERAKQKAASAVGAGRAGTILTSPIDPNSIGGASSGALTGGKTLLGN